MDEMLREQPYKVLVRINDDGHEMLNNAINQ